MKVPVTVLRRGREMRLEVPVRPVLPIETRAVLLWQGLLLQQTASAVLLQDEYMPDGGGLFVTKQLSGSAAQKYGLYASVWVTEV